MLLVFENKPLISIIVPVYKTERYLCKCVESIISQTYDNLEIILVDDGSPDNCGKICDEYKKKDKRVNVIHQDNAGVSAARNSGLDLAKGEFTGFVDSDDWIRPDMFEKLLRAMTKNESIQIAVCGHTRYHTDGSTEKRENPEISETLSVNKMLPYLISDSYFEGFVWNKLFDSNLFNNKNKLRFDTDAHFGEDMLFVSECVAGLKAKTDSIAYIPEALYNYILSEDGAMYSYGAKRRTELDSWKKVIDVLEPVSGESLKYLRARYTELAINLTRMAVLAKDTRNIRVIRKEVKKYWFEYFFKIHRPFKVKLRCFIIFLFPKTSDKIYKILKFNLKRENLWRL